MFRRMAILAVFLIGCSRQTPHMGQHGVVWTPDGESVQTFLSGSHGGFVRLEPGTAVVVVDADPISCRIRVESGDHAGGVGFMPARVIRPVD